MIQPGDVLDGGSWEPFVKMFFDVLAVFASAAGSGRWRERSRKGAWKGSFGYPLP